MKNNALLLIGIAALFFFTRKKEETIVDTEQNSGSGEARNPDFILNDVQVDSTGQDLQNTGVKTNANAGAKAESNSGSSSSGSSDFRVG